MYATHVRSLSLDTFSLYAKLPRKRVQRFLAFEANNEPPEAGLTPAFWFVTQQGKAQHLVTHHPDNTNPSTTVFFAQLIIASYPQPRKIGAISGLLINNDNGT